MRVYMKINWWPRDMVGKVLVCDIVVKEFELQVVL